MHVALIYGVYVYLCVNARRTRCRNKTSSSGSDGHQVVRLTASNAKTGSARRNVKRTICRVSREGVSLVENKGSNAYTTQPT